MRQRIVLRGGGGLARLLATAAGLFVLVVVFGRVLFTKPLLAILSFGGLTLSAWAGRNRWWHASAELGSDGVAFAGRKGALPVFVSWRDVRSVRLDSQEVELQTKSDVLQLHPTAEPTRLFDALQRRLEVYRERERAEVPHMLLDNDPDEGAYRTAAPPADVLVRVAEDAGLDDELRALAAELAAKGGEKDAVEELAQDTANPAMRAFLEKLL